MKLLASTVVFPECQNWRQAPNCAPLIDWLKYTSLLVPNASWLIHRPLPFVKFPLASGATFAHANATPNADGVFGVPEAYD